jgi:hypothetical protein
MSDRRPEFDDRDAEILAHREAAWNARSGPRVGDYVILQNGLYDRFTYDMKDKIQVGGGLSLNNDMRTDGGYGFYLGDGYADYSGGLNPPVPKSHLELTEETRDGGFWFFHHGSAGANRGVYFKIRCRVYRLHDNEV